MSGESVCGYSVSLTGGAAVAANPLGAGDIAIDRNDKFSSFSTCALGATDCVTLPIAPRLFSEYQIKNLGAANLKIFPSPGTASSATATIDSASTGSPYYLAPSACVTMVAIANTATTGATWLIKNL